MADHVDEEQLVLHLNSQLDAASARALESHLDGCSRCRRVAAELVRGDAPASDEDDVMIGRSFDGWLVERLLGSGSFSEVYLAHHTSIERPCAVKVLKRAHPPEHAARLLEEARAVNRIRHPGIIDVFGAGTTPGGRPYLLMELLEGETLKSLLARRQRLPADEVMTLLEGVLEPLDAAHRAGVLHRDLKPANVFIGPRRGARPAPVKLLDFGLAKQGVALDGLAASTRGRIVGTPAYMAPEQCREGGAVGAPTDLYAVGIIAYELLTGAVPFTGPSAVKVMMRHVQQLPAPLPDDVPPGLAGWVMHLLVKEPRARPPSAQVALASLRQLRHSAEQVSASAVTLGMAEAVLVPGPTVPELPPADVDAKATVRVAPVKRPAATKPKPKPRRGGGTALVLLSALAGGVVAGGALATLWL